MTPLVDVMFVIWTISGN